MRPKFRHHYCWLICQRLMSIFDTDILFCMNNYYVLLSMSRMSLRRISYCTASPAISSSCFPFFSPHPWYKWAFYNDKDDDNVSHIASCNVLDSWEVFCEVWVRVHIDLIYLLNICSMRAKLFGGWRRRFWLQRSFSFYSLWTGEFWDRQVLLFSIFIACVFIPDICHFFYTGSICKFKILHPQIY